MFRSVCFVDDVRVGYNSKTTGVICGTGIANPSLTYEFTPVFSGVRIALSLVFRLLFCRLLFVVLTIALSVLLNLRLLITYLVSLHFLKQSQCKFKRNFPFRKTANHI